MPSEATSEERSGFLEAVEDDDHGKGHLIQLEHAIGLDLTSGLDRPVCTECMGLTVFRSRQSTLLRIDFQVILGFWIAGATANSTKAEHFPYTLTLSTSLSTSLKQTIRARLPLSVYEPEGNVG